MSSNVCKPRTCFGRNLSKQGDVRYRPSAGARSETDVRFQNTKMPLNPMTSTYSTNTSSTLLKRRQKCQTSQLPSKPPTAVPALSAVRVSNPLRVMAIIAVLWG